MRRSIEVVQISNNLWQQTKLFQQIRDPFRPYSLVFLAIPTTSSVSQGETAETHSIHRHET